jgi:hypothetical protein
MLEVEVRFIELERFGVCPVLPTIFIQTNQKPPFAGGFLVSGAAKIGNSPKTWFKS